MSSQGDVDLGDSDGSEWEYEYSNTETESLYVIFDLPLDPVRQKSGKSGKPQPNITDATNEAVDHRATNHASSKSRSPDFALSDARKRVQILGLETRSPMVSYDNQIYDCKWGTTVGTDLMFAAPSDFPTTKPLVEDSRFHLVATTRLKLAGTPVQLIQRTSAEDQVLPSSASRPQQGPLVAPSAENSDERPVRLAVPATATEAGHAQASFLEGLIAAKLARGDTDKVYIGKGKDYELPDGPELTSIPGQRIVNPRSADMDMASGPGDFTGTAQLLPPIERVLGNSSGSREDNHLVRSSGTDDRQDSVGIEFAHNNKDTQPNRPNIAMSIGSRQQESSGGNEE